MNATYKLITNAEDLRHACDELSQQSVVGFDTETTSLDPYSGRVRLVQFAAPGGSVYIIDLDCFSDGNDGAANSSDGIYRNAALAPLKKLLADARPVKIAHNAKFDAKWIKHQLDVELGGLFDTLLASQLVSAGNTEDRHSLEVVAARYLEERVDKAEQLSDWNRELSEAQLEYAARDAAVLVPLRERLVERLKAENLIQCATLEFDCVLPVAGLELAGFYLDQARWREQIANVEHVRARLAGELQEMLAEGTMQQTSLFGETRVDFNIDSHVQLTKALKRLGVPVPDSTRNWKLQPLAEEYPVVKKLLEYRTVQKSLTSYGENILDPKSGYINPHTQRIHANFHQIGAPTGRFACLTGETLVATPVGFKRMDALREDDFVQTSYGFKRVEKAWLNGTRQVYKIQLKDGRSIRATEDHRFLAGKADTWKRLDELRIGDKLYTSLKHYESEESGGSEQLDEFYPLNITFPEVRSRKPVTVPTALSIELCELAGLMVADEKLIARFGQLPSLKPIVDYLDLELRPVEIESITVDAIEKVYDITVEGVHEFIANGIVVHNCTQPNIQQVPHATEYRRCFRAPDGRKLIVADYSQVELRILAHITGDQGFIDAFNSGADLHRVTAAQVFGVPLDEVTADQRSFAKRLNFGVVYGIGAQRFSMMTGLSLTESEDILRRYFATYRALDTWLREAARRAVRERTARTLSNRLARFTFDPADKQAASLAQRNGKNMPIQGSSADILKRALRLLHDKLRDSSARIVNIVHDEIVVEADAADAEEIAQTVEAAMCAAGEEYVTRVPIKVETEIADEWVK